MCNTPTQEPAPAPTSMTDPDNEQCLWCVLETICNGPDELDNLLHWFVVALDDEPQPCLVLHGWPQSGMSLILNLAKLLLGSESLVVYDEQNDELRAGRWAADDALPNVLVGTTMPLPEHMEARCTVVRCRRPMCPDAAKAPFRHFGDITHAALTDKQLREELRGAVQRLALRAQE